MFAGPPGKDLQNGLLSGRFKLEPDFAVSYLSMVGGCTLSAMILVLDGQKTWRAAGAECAELLLRAAGISVREAKKIGNADLPALPKLE
jgi:hypothetical protein